MRGVRNEKEMQEQERRQEIMMSPIGVDDVEFQEGKLNCPYRKGDSTRPKCIHPRGILTLCIARHDCPMSEKQWKEIVLKQKVEFKPYAEMIN